MLTKLIDKKFFDFEFTILILRTPIIIQIISFNYQMSMKKFLHNLFLILFMVARTFAQDRTITGVVTAKEDGLPLPGASVLVLGTKLDTQKGESGGASVEKILTLDAKIGTQTNIDGRFSIVVPSAAKQLEFAFMGYAKQRVTVGANRVVNVVLVANTKQLNEVVVTALGQTRLKNTLPYSVQQVTGEEVSKSRSSNFISGLSGKVSGLEIRQNNTMGGSMNVVLRGNTSFTGSNQALFVVNGVPIDNTVSNSATQKSGGAGYDYGNPVSDINPDDIASISVLKGAAASALYGSRGFNGVILITTKKGSKGLGITVNSGASVGGIDKSTFVKYQTEYGAGYRNSFLKPAAVNPNLIPYPVARMGEDASYGPQFNPNQLVYQWDAFDPTSPNYNKPTPWIPAANGPVTFFENPVSVNNSIFITGGGDKGTYKMGYTRSNEAGVLPNSKIDKDMINFSSTLNITDQLTAGGSIDYTKIRGSGRYGTGYDNNNLMTNFRQWFQTNVDVQQLKEAYARTGQNTTWNPANAVKKDLHAIFWDNPYFVMYQNTEQDERNRYFGNVNLNYKAAPWLNILGRISLDHYNEIQEEHQAVGTTPNQNPPYYRRYNRSFSEFNYDLLLSFDKKINSDWDFKGLLGSNIRSRTYQYIRAQTNGGLAAPSTYSLANSLYSINAPAESLQQSEVDGIFIGSTFIYKEMLTLDFTARRDRSSTLPKGNNVYYYPAVSASLQFSKLLDNLSWLSNGKVRLNYAEVGNDAPVHSIDDVYLKPTPFGTTTLFSVNTVKNNPNLKPERVQSFETGVELSFLNDRIGLDATYYRATAFDQIFNLAVSTASGYSSEYINAGSVLNHGIELGLTGSPVKTENFSWNVNVNWTANRSKVNELYGNLNTLVIGAYQGGVNISARVGQPYGVITGSDFVYQNGQKVVGPDGDYLKTATSDQVIGNSNPKWIAGINNTFRYKDVSLKFLVDIRHGGDVFSLDQYYGLATGLYPETAGLNDLGNPSRNPVTTGGDSGGFIRPGVQADGQRNTVRVSNDFQAYGYDKNPDAAFVYDASYIKLREVAITYALPKRMLVKLGPVKGVDFSLVGRNLWIIHKNLPYADPEEGVSAGNAQGFQGGAYPSTRIFGFNVKLRF